MTEVVADASALVAAVTRSEGELRARLTVSTVHAPHLVDAEVGHALRRLTARGALGDDGGAAALQTAAALVHQRYPHAGTLSQLAWSLRANLSFYDALYVALAAALDIPVLTVDARLTRAPGLPCSVELC